MSHYSNHILPNKKIKKNKKNKNASQFQHHHQDGELCGDDESKHLQRHAVIFVPKRHVFLLVPRCLQPNLEWVLQGFLAWIFSLSGILWLENKYYRIEEKYRA